MGRKSRLRRRQHAQDLPRRPVAVTSVWSEGAPDSLSQRRGTIWPRSPRSGSDGNDLLLASAVEAVILGDNQGVVRGRDPACVMASPVRMSRAASRAIQAKPIPIESRWSRPATLLSDPALEAETVAAK
jgi:hypothetical protein